MGRVTGARGKAVTGVLAAYIGSRRPCADVLMCLGVVHGSGGPKHGHVADYVVKDDM